METIRFSIIQLIIIVFLVTLIPLNVVEARYYKGNIHTHTTQSDGEQSPDSLVKIYKAKGYEFLSITDHDKIIAVPGVETATFILIPGNEVSNKYSGPTLCFHTNGFMVSTVNTTLTSNQAIINDIRNQGGVPMINHPMYRWCSTNIWSTSKITSVTGCTLMEIYNRNAELDGFGSATALWDSVLSAGKMLFGVADDDGHRWADYGYGWVMVKAGVLQDDSITAALDRGDFYSTTGIIIDSIFAGNGLVYVSSAMADTIIFYGKNHARLSTVNSHAASYAITQADIFARAELKTADGKKAWAQPAFYEAVSIASNLPVQAQLKQTQPATKAFFFNIQGRTVPSPGKNSAYQLVLIRSAEKSRARILPGSLIPKGQK
jgi:hypothetical protein